MQNGLVECKAVFEAYLEELAEENIVASEQKVIETSVEKKQKFSLFMVMTTL